jgi:tRNA A-37 threonylcarbamoyl transferase component Bud32
MEAPAPKRRLAGRYVLGELIATGGMAAVWRARDEVLARTVAVKILREDLAVDSDFPKRFQREAVAAARLTHPNIVSVYDTGIDDEVSFIVMEHSDGRNLQEVMSDRGPVEPEEAASLVEPVLGALAYAHQNGVVHRDIKPANILVADDGRVKVTDFGIAKAAFTGTDLTTTGKALGTVRYLSPEQVQGSEVDARSDLYSLGIVLYELLTGRVPFKAESDMAVALMRLNQDPIPPRDFRGGIPRELEALVLKALARRPQDRFQSAESMLAALERAGNRAGFSATQPFSPTRLGASSRQGAQMQPSGAPGPSVFRSWMLVPLILLILAGAAIAGGLALGRLEIGGPLGVRAAPNSPTGAKPPGLVQIQVEAAKDFDPEGSDRSEHPEDTSLAIDGERATAWATDHYNSARFGGLKDGLGLWLDLGTEVQVDQLNVVSPLAGWTFEVKAGSSPQATAGALPATDGSTSFTIGPKGLTVVHLKPVQTSGLLLWITELAPDGGRYAASIAEVTLEGLR